MKKIIVAILSVAMAFSCFAFAGCNQEADALKLINIKLTDEQYAYGVTKGNSDLLADVNDYLAKIKENGTFDEILAKYFENEGTKVGSSLGTYDASKNQLVVITNTPFEPFEYVGTDGKYYGVDMEIANGLAAELDMELCIIEHVNFDTICEQVNKYPNAIVMAGLTYSEERAEIVDFSDTYYEASQMLIVKGSDTTFDDCTTSEDVIEILSGFNSSVSIGFQNGTTGQLFVEGDESWGFTGFDATPAGYNTAALAAQALVNGSIQYVIVDAAPAQAIVAAMNELN